MTNDDAVSMTPHACMAELLCESPVVMKKDVREGLVADLRASLGRITVMRSEETTLHLALEDCLVEYKDGKSLPAQMLFLSSASKERDPDKAKETLETSLGQTWNWPEARAAAENAPHTLLVMDFMSTALEPRRRLENFPKALYAAISRIPCAALHFPTSQCLVSPRDFLANIPDGEDSFPLLGLVNVRLFSVRDKEDEFVMDSLGLHVFGLPDVQCHAAGIDPDALGSWLFSLALYVATTDRAIETGDTIDGVDGERMVMIYEESLVSPRRVVLDVQMPSALEE